MNFSDLIKTGTQHNLEMSLSLSFVTKNHHVYLCKNVFDDLLKILDNTEIPQVDVFFYSFSYLEYRQFVGISILSQSSLVLWV